MHVAATRPSDVASPAPAVPVVPAAAGRHGRSRACRRRPAPAVAPGRRGGGGRHARKAPRPDQRRLSFRDRRQGPRPALRPLSRARRRHDAAGDLRRGLLPHAARPARPGQGAGEQSDRHPDRPDARLRHPRPLLPRGDGRARDGRRPELPAAAERAHRQGDRAGQRQPRPGQGRVGRGQRRGVHRLPAVDPPARPDAPRPVRRADRPGQHAPRLPEPGRDRPLRPGGPGPDRPLGAKRREQPPDRAAGQLRHALLRDRRHPGLVRLLRPVRAESREAARRGPPRAGPARLRRHHVPGDQRRHVAGRLRQAAAEDHDRRVRGCPGEAGRRGGREGRAPRRPAAGDGPARDPGQIPRPDRRAPGSGEEGRRGDERPAAEDHPRGLRPRAGLPERAAAGVDAPAGDPRRRLRDRGDAERGLRADRPEDQGPEPAADDDERRAGQRRAGLHPPARAAQARRLHDLARPLQLLRRGRRAEDGRGGARAAGRGLRASRAAR